MARAAAVTQAGGMAVDVRRSRSSMGVSAGAIDGDAGVDSGIRGHNVRDSMCGDVYFEEPHYSARLAGGECVGRD